jgi:hypothetical protein
MKKLSHPGSAGKLLSQRNADSHLHTLLANDLEF